VTAIDYLNTISKLWLASAGVDKQVSLWDTERHTCIATIDGHSSRVYALRFHPHLPLLLSGAWDSSVKLWNRDSNRWVYMGGGWLDCYYWS
jgi:WD40 repeat protein